MMVNITEKIMGLKMSSAPEEIYQMSGINTVCVCVYPFSCSSPLCVGGFECVHHSYVYQGRASEVAVKSSDLLKSLIKNT